MRDRCHSSPAARALPDEQGAIEDWGSRPLSRWQGAAGDVPTSAARPGGTGGTERFSSATLLLSQPVVRAPSDRACLPRRGW